MHRHVRTILGAIALNLAFGAMFGILLAVSQGSESIAALARSAAVSIIYANLIGLPCWFGIEALFHRFAHRSPVLLWTGLIAIVAASTLVACLLAGLLLVAVGWWAREDYWPNFAYSLRLSAVIGVLCTAGGVIHGRLRSRLDDSRRAELEARALATRAQLVSLESRMHPHFLFNSLNSVMSLIPDEPARAEHLLEKLASVLRFSLDAERRGLIPLREELAIVQDYLEIEAARLGDRLTTIVDVPDELADVGVPPFSVQTAVENSIRHAIATRRRGGQVAVHARRAGGEVAIEVADDGPGFDRSALGEGHGLDNLIGRLDALFGDRARVEIDRRDGGMAVTVVVPA